LLNSHDGTSSYQMLVGVFRFVCQNGTVWGNTVGDIRVRHQGDIDGAFRVVDTFDEVGSQMHAMKRTCLDQGEAHVFARAVLTLKYGAQAAAPVTADQLLQPRRWEERAPDLWTTFNVVHENLMRGGLRGRSVSGKAIRIRAVAGIEQSIHLNRALWQLAEELRALKH
jgi:hypothetical protein